MDGQWFPGQRVQFEGRGGSYRANAVAFDGTNDFLTRGAGWTGLSDSDRMLMSFWLKLSGGEGSFQRILNAVSSVGGSTNRTRFFKETTDTFKMFIGRSDGIDFLGYETNSAIIKTANGWQHFLLELDVSVGTNRLYVNDSSQAMTESGGTGSSWDITQADWGLGGRPDGNSKLNGDLADFMVWWGLTLPNISTESVRRNFISAAGKPIAPAVAVAAYGTPVLAFYGDTDSWHTNKGSGGGMTENGALTTATTSPSD